MKIRDGFVSNSSSSSFVVAFPKKPMSVEATKELVFGSKEIVNHDECFGKDLVVTTQKAAEVIFNDLKKQHQAMTLKELIEEISCGWYDGYPEFNDNNAQPGTKEHDQAWRDYDKLVEDKAKIIAEDFWEKNKGKLIFKFNYADEGGRFYAVMEHSNIFKCLPNIRINHH
jgi:hypothetical protein